ncbi:putative derlin, Rhomboid-like superfamily [Helianthus annuus]|nr:putative derlin, Rhomboid-like superfamily [Helianthus annuus]
MMQIWRLITNFIFIGSFSFTFAFRLFIILKYGVQLERGPFDKRTADYVWMFFFGAFSLLAISAIPFLRSPFMGASLVFMIVYVWSRELPNTRINFHGLVEFKVLKARSYDLLYANTSTIIEKLIVMSMQGFYLPWTMLAIDLVLGNPLMPSLLGIGVGHLYYFLTVLYPLAGGNDICKTPFWVYPYRFSSNQNRHVARLILWVGFAIDPFTCRHVNEPIVQ